MYSAPRLALKYLSYLLTARNGRGHGIHSPFVFDLVTSVLRDKREFYAYGQVEALRRELLQNNDTLPVLDLGAGTSAGKPERRSIASIAHRAAKPKKYGQTLFRLALHYQPARIVELGTSLGISTAYLALACPGARVITCEGAGAIAAQARHNFQELGLQNIRVVEGNFDDSLPGLLPDLAPVDFVFLDGNHRMEPTLRYFEQVLAVRAGACTLVVDDIHWSREMEMAWERIKSHPEVLLTVDLFFIGLVFFRPEFKVKQHFRIRY